MLVVARAPVPGKAKTRLAAGVGDEMAADMAAAALLDTLDAAAQTHMQGLVVAMTGDLSHARREDEIRSRLQQFTVIEQHGETFADVLANAHADAAAVSGAYPILQIGMDTPQVTPELLTRCATELLSGHAILGLAHDGGWWVLGVTEAGMAGCLRQVPMSRPYTGAVTLTTLREHGYDVRLVQELGDVDTVDDVERVRLLCAPDSRFAHVARVVMT